MENSSEGALIGGRAPENSLKLKNITSLDIYEVPIKLIRSHFQFNYCTTCHSVQGSTFHESITIFDYKFFFVSRKWIWTAIGRARNLDDVYFDECRKDKTQSWQFYDDKIVVCFDFSEQNRNKWELKIFSYPDIEKR